MVAIIAVPYVYKSRENYSPGDALDDLICVCDQCPGDAGSATLSSFGSSLSLGSQSTGRTECAAAMLATVTYMGRQRSWRLRSNCA